MRAVTGRRGPYLLLLAGLLFLVDTSCAKMIPIPEVDYKKTDAARKETYRLTTKENRIYDFEKFSVTDSTLVILEVKSYGENPSLHDVSKIETPVVVPWGDVTSLERYDYWNLGTALGIVGCVTVAGCVLYYVLMMATLGAALSGLN